MVPHTSKFFTMFSFQETLVFPLESTLTFRYPLNVVTFTDFSSWCLSADVESLEVVVYSSLDRWDMPQRTKVPFSRLDFQDKVRLATLGSNTLPRTSSTWHGCGGEVRYSCHFSDISQLSINPDKNTIAKLSGILLDDKVNSSHNKGTEEG